MTTAVGCLGDPPGDPGFNLCGLLRGVLGGFPGDPPNLNLAFSYVGELGGFWIHLNQHNSACHSFPSSHSSTHILADLLIQ